MNLYHVNVFADGEPLTVGAAAFTKTEAAMLVCERLKNDGYKEVGIDTAGLVERNTKWTPGNVLVY